MDAVLDALRTEWTKMIRGWERRRESGVEHRGGWILEWSYNDDDNDIAASAASLKTTLAGL